MFALVTHWKFDGSRSFDNHRELAGSVGYEHIQADLQVYQERIYRPMLAV